MDEQRLWAPWRLGYIKGTDPPEATPEPAHWCPEANHDCFLCRAAATDTDTSIDQKLLRVAQDELTVTVLNLYPYSNAHLLVSPLRHVGSFSELTDDEHLALQRTLARMSERLKERVMAHGFNIGLNVGSVAGAGVPGHLHWHLVPRWPGDHNFMPTTSGIRVLPQSLDEAWQILRDDSPAE